MQEIFKPLGNPYRGTGFTQQFRRRSREFFGYMCVFCGSDRSKKLEVHHVHYNPDHVIDEMDYLSHVVPLCTGCHRYTIGHEDWKEFWANLYDWFIDEQCGGRYLMPRDGTAYPIEFVPVANIICDKTVIHTSSGSIIIPVWAREIASLSRTSCLRWEDVIK